MILNRLRINQKICLSNAIGLSIVSLGMLFGILVGNHLQRQAKLELDEIVEEGRLLRQFQTNLLEVESHRKGLITLLSQPEELKQVYTEYEDDVVELSQLWSKLKAVNEQPRVGATHHRTLPNLAKTHDRFMQNYFRQSDILSQQIDVQNVKPTDIANAQTVLSEFTFNTTLSKDLFDFVEELENLVEANAEELEEVEALFTQVLQLQSKILVGSLLLSVVIAALLTGYIGRGIANPLQVATQLAQQVSQSDDFSLRVPVISQDEVGVLTTMLNQLIERVQQLLKERQAAEAQLIQSEKMSSLGQLVAGVAHEINNPINFIHGNLSHATTYTQDLFRLVQLYQQQYPNPAPEIEAEISAIELNFLKDDLTKLLQSMKTGTDRIRDIVLSLRNFSRLDEAEFKAVNVHEGIESTLLILGYRLKAAFNHTAIQIEKDYGQLPLVECYPGQLNQVFMNLLGNAIDALEELVQQRTPKVSAVSPSTIKIWTEVLVGDWVAIHIADNGAGMSKEARSRLFNPFFTTKPMGKGTGLGLSISYQIVTEKHGGKLHCYSTLGQGTEFVIQIPIRQQKPRNLLTRHSKKL
ncbi:MAG: HAMP domain-containing histidine kinase [Cyanobacteria bacterium CRU_2_1]|nr:HAMP domain-containing histidine kinase [Cyanobacteria bacterium CRU_2_1]